jgi:hypothetical protein
MQPIKTPVQWSKSDIWYPPARAGVDPLRSLAPPNGPDAPNRTLVDGYLALRMAGLGLDEGGDSRQPLLPACASDIAHEVQPATVRAMAALRPSCVSAIELRSPWSASVSPGDFQFHHHCAVRPTILA